MAPLSNFISIKMKKVHKQSRIPIKLPKLLVNTMKKRADHHRGDHHNNNNNSKCGRYVSFVFTNPFAKHKSPEKSSSSKSNEACKNGSKVGILKVRLPLLSFLSRKEGLKKLMRNVTDSIGVGGVGGVGGHLVRVIPQPMLNKCKKLRMSMPYMKERRMKSKEKLEEDNSCMRERKIKSKEKWEENSSEYELCKKRILKGGKCKSGTLHYDQNGNLLSEVHP